VILIIEGPGHANLILSSFSARGNHLPMSLQDQHWLRRRLRFEYRSDLGEESVDQPRTVLDALRKFLPTSV